MEINEKLKALRLARSLTQKELSSIINISDKVISKWERGVSLPKIDTLIALAKFYDVSLNEILQTNASASKVFNKQKIEKSIPFYILSVTATLLFLIGLIWFLCVYITHGNEVVFTTIGSGYEITSYLNIGFIYLVMQALFLIAFTFICNAKVNISAGYSKRFCNSTFNQIVKSPYTVKNLYKALGVCYATIILIFQIHFFISIVFYNLMIVKPYYITLCSSALLIISIILTPMITYKVMWKYVKREKA